MIGLGLTICTGLATKVIWLICRGGQVVKKIRETMRRCVVVLACAMLSLLSMSVTAYASDESPALDDLVTAPVPEPDPVPAPVIEPAPAPEPLPEPAPSLTPEPAPSPMPELLPSLTPEPLPSPEPVPGLVLELPASSSPASDAPVFPVPVPALPAPSRFDVPMFGAPSAAPLEAAAEQVAGAEETSAAAVMVAPGASKAADPTSLPQPVTTTIDAVVATATGSPLYVQILTVMFLLAVGVLYFRVLGAKSRNPAKMGKQPAP